MTGNWKVTPLYIFDTQVNDISGVYMQVINSVYFHSNYFDERLTGYVPYSLKYDWDFVISWISESCNHKTELIWYGFLEGFLLGVFVLYLWCWKHLTDRKIINHQNLYLHGLSGFHFWLDWTQNGRLIFNAQRRVDLFLWRTHDVINFLGFHLNCSWLLIL